MLRSKQPWHMALHRWGRNAILHATQIPSNSKLAAPHPRFCTGLLDPTKQVFAIHQVCINIRKTRKASVFANVIIVMWSHLVLLSTAEHEPKAWDQPWMSLRLNEMVWATSLQKALDILWTYLRMYQAPTGGCLPCSLPWEVSNIDSAILHQPARLNWCKNSGDLCSKNSLKKGLIRYDETKSPNHQTSKSNHWFLRESHASWQPQHTTTATSSQQKTISIPCIFVHPWHDRPADPPDPGQWRLVVPNLKTTWKINPPISGF